MGLVSSVYLLDITDVFSGDDSSHNSELGGRMRYQPGY